MTCCPENLLHDYSTTVTFHFPSNTDMQSHTLDVVIIWNCLIQKSTNTHIFLATFSVLLSHRDWVPEFPLCVSTCAWPFSFLYPACTPFLTIWTILSPVPLIPSSYASAASTHQNPHFKISGTICILYYEIQAAESWRIWNIWENWSHQKFSFQPAPQEILLFILDHYSLHPCFPASRFAFWYQKLSVILLGTRLEPLFLSGMPFSFSPFTCSTFFKIISFMKLPWPLRLGSVLLISTQCPVYWFAFAT